MFRLQLVYGLAVSVLVTAQPVPVNNAPVMAATNNGHLDVYAANWLGKRDSCVPGPDPVTSVCLQYPITFDGLCGIDTGKRCPDNQCCANNGQCVDIGSSSCFVGSSACQLGFGQCILDDYTEWTELPRVICTSTVTVYSTGTPTPSVSVPFTPVLPTSVPLPPQEENATAAQANYPRPPPAGLYYGVHTDWAVQNPPVYAFLFKVNPVVYTSFLSLTDTYQAAAHASHVDQILAAYSLVPPQLRKRGFIYVLSAMPWNGMRGITDQGLAQLVAACRDSESKGVHVIVRFAHEMNGLWYPWGQDRQEVHHRTFACPSMLTRVVQGWIQEGHNGNQSR